MFFLVPTFFKKAAIFNYIHSCGFWRAFRQFSVVLAIMWPTMSFWFFMNYGNPLIFNFRLLPMYFTGILAFTGAVAIFWLILVDRPAYALTHMKRDRALTNRLFEWSLSVLSEKN